MTRRWGWQLSVRALATAVLTAAVAPGIATAAPPPHDQLSLQPRSFGARPADIWTRSADGNLLAEHRPGATTPDTMRLNYPQVTVTIRATLPTDPAPQQVYASVLNTDDARRFGTTIDMSSGVQRLSVPEGTYSVLVLSVATDEVARTHEFRMGFAVDQHLTGPGGVIRIDLTAAQRTGFPTYHTAPGAEVLDRLQFYDLQDGQGRDTAGSWEIFGAPRDQLLVAGRPGGTAGRLVSMNQTVERGAGSGRPMYYLTWGHRNAVVADEQVAVSDAALTRVQRHYYTDGATHDGIAARTPIYPYFDPGVLTFDNVAVPSVRNEYVFAPPRVLWLNDVQVHADGGGFADLIGFARYPRGGDVEEDLWRGPLAPGVATQPPGARTYPAGGPRTCWVCRTATGMSVGLDAVVGSQPNYGALLFAQPGQRPRETHLTVYRDDGVVFDGTNSGAGVFSGSPARFATPSGGHAYRIVETANRAADGMSLSTTATTDYRFRSSATSDPQLDPSWDCGAPGAGACTVLPLLAVRVPLPTSLTGTLPSGYSFLVADVGHVQGAAASPIKALSLAINAAGSGWIPQTVESLGGGRYYVAIHNTAAPGTPVSMRWHARDAAGSSITQTVRDAYVIDGS